MTDRMLRHTVVWLALACIALHAETGVCSSPVTVIFDTDISTDVDDVGAVAVLHALADRGSVEILGMMVSSGDPWSAPCLAALNTWFGRRDIPVGAVSGRSVSEESTYTKALASSSLQEQEQPAESVALYRKLLAEQPDLSVTVITVGYLTNLAGLLSSQADDVSRLDGRELVRKKVRMLVCMGGTYPSGREWNFYQDSRSTAEVVNNWPGAILFCGYERGVSVLTGAGLKQSQPGNPVRRAYELYNGLSDRPSWDQLTVLIGSQNGEVLEGVAGFFDVVRGVNVVNEDGSNRWMPLADGPHGYVTSAISDRQLEERIEGLMAAAVEKAVNAR